MKIVNTASPVVLTVSKTPLTALLTIEQVDNQPVTQVMDAALNIYSPDRESITGAPLILKPLFEAYDADHDEKYTPQADYYWYINKVQDTFVEGEGKIPTTSAYCATTATIAQKAPGYYYEIDSNSQFTGRLFVKKNIHYEHSVKLYCVAEYEDPAVTGPGNGLMKQEAMVLLSSQNLPEEFFKVSIEAPATITYDPFWDGETKQKQLKAVVMKGSTTLSTPEDIAREGVVFEWRYLETNNGVVTEQRIPTDGSFLGYVSGQDTDTLTIDCDYIDGETFIVRIKAPNEQQVLTFLPTEDKRVVSWVFSRLEAQPYSLSGSAVKEGNTSLDFQCFVKNDGKDLSDALRSEYVLLNWFRKPEGELAVDHGWGDSLTIPASLIQGNTEIYVEMTILGVKKRVTQSGENITYEGEDVLSRV